MKNTRIAIIGAGNIGTAIALGLAESPSFNAKYVTLTRRKVQLLGDLKKLGFNVESENRKAIKNSEVIVIAVEPQQIDVVLKEISVDLEVSKHVLISVVTGVTTQQIKNIIRKKVPVVRAMPNTGIAVGESMTCVASEERNGDSIKVAKSIFDTVGKTLVINEEQMNSATALVACGIAFFLRAIRAASQGGIEIGFHSQDALAMAAQTAKGAASLLLTNKQHPEFEIDKVTTPRGCTIAGLNRMEHEGFSSAMIRGIVVSADMASKLYDNNK